MVSNLMSRISQGLSQTPAVEHDLLTLQGSIESNHTQPDMVQPFACPRCCCSNDTHDNSICPQCGVSLPSPVLLRHTSQSDTRQVMIRPSCKRKYKEEVTGVSGSRRMHFRAAILAFEGRSNKNIPCDLLQYVRDRTSTQTAITPGHISHILRTCGRFSRYYTCVNQIWGIVTGKQTPSIRQHETTLMLMFENGVSFSLFCHAYQQEHKCSPCSTPFLFENGVSFSLFCHAHQQEHKCSPCSTPFLFDRVHDICSDIGVRYVLCQLLRILGYEIDPWDFDCVRSVDSAMKCDSSWQRICSQLGWKFHATV